MIESVLSGVRDGVPAGTPLVVVTSVHSSDDPMAAYLGSIGQPCFRGPLADVLGRFRQGLAQWPCEWVLRINADSPLLNPAVIRQVLDARNELLDLVTTTFPRTFPKGQNAELIRSAAFLGIDDRDLDDEDREHVTRYFYSHADRFRIVNVVSANSSLADLDLAVDTVEDLVRLENLSLDDTARAAVVSPA